MKWLVIFLTMHLSLCQEQTEPYATLNPEIFSALELLLPDYNFPANVYDWNMTEIVTLIEKQIPGILCAVDKSFYSSFPVEKLKEIPTPILYCQHLYCLIDENVLNKTYNLTYSELDVNCTAYNSSKKKKKKNYKNVLRLGDTYKKKNALFSGYSVSKSALIHQFKLCGVSVSILLLIVLSLNQCIEHHKQQEAFCQRGMVYQSTAIITVLWSVIILLWGIIDISGSSNFLCMDTQADSAYSNEKIIACVLLLFL
ncbi:hypothetical protein RFI_07791 [Reticulomyxa filosa]|uniref:Uncharacterized protein n=1 Tax=Reticulomyxa filosa TaxID=46433 RepID=X6NTM7_RETFI|nr:hypothetical protein RFI_07791 [Reticulomyxa filosa]|eukprot:ETO29331.1 hypothetical protein RFI_07791 [Reticulomyxa filosa]